MKEYRWLKINYKEEHKWKWVNASYDNKTQTITIYERLLKKDDEFIEMTLFHEWCHFIYMTKVSRIIKAIWKLVSNWKLLKILNILLWKRYKKNNYVSWEARRNANEDFARCLAQWRKHWTYNSYVDLKIEIAENILNYFSKTK